MKVTMLGILGVVMNGKGNNMNCVDAARYAADVCTKVAIPAHWGLFEKFPTTPTGSLTKQKSWASKPTLHPCLRSLTQKTCCVKLNERSKL